MKTQIAAPQELITPCASGPGRADTRLARSIWFLGGLMTVHMDAQDTQNAFALVEASGGPGGEPPLHIHTKEDEMFYVLEGELKVFRGAEEIVLRPGEAALLPRGVPHTFRIRSDYARWLVLVTPAGFEEYFREIGSPARYMAPERNPEPPDLARLVRVGQSFGLSFQPATPFGA